MSRSREMASTSRPTAFHVTAHRWLGETLALQYLVDTCRPGTAVLRYEDLVNDPAGLQRTLGLSLGLRPCAPPDGFLSRFRASPHASTAMHGVRPIDAASVGRHRSDPRKVAHDLASRGRPAETPMFSTVDDVASSSGRQSIGAEISPR